MTYAVRPVHDAGKPQPLLTAEAKLTIPYREQDGKLLGEWNAIRWAELTTITETLAVLASEVLGVNLEFFRCDPYEFPSGNHVRVGIDISLKAGAELRKDANIILSGATKRFLMKIRSRTKETSGDLFEAGVCVGEGHDGSDCVEIAQKCANEFIEKNGGKRIKVPFRVMCSDDLVEVTGAYRQRPPLIQEKREPISIIGMLDLLGISSRKLELLQEHGSRVTVSFEEDKHIKQLKERLGDRKLYRFVISDEYDIDGRLVRMVTELGEEVPRCGDLF